MSQHDEAAARAFVREVRAKGSRQWVLHRQQGARGVRALNLEDPEDTAGLTSQEIADLSEQAFSDYTSHLGPPIPIQPWEVEKLTEVARQVMAAFEGGRYSKDFGSALLGHLRGWRGADEWAKAEEARVASLVNDDDASSRAAFRSWIEESLLSTLRAMQADADRGFMAGTARSSSPEGGVASAAASTSGCSDVRRVLQGSWAECQAAAVVGVPLWAFEEDPSDEERVGSHAHGISKKGEAPNSEKEGRVKSEIHPCVFAGVDDQEPAEAAASSAKAGGSADKLSAGEVVADASKVDGCSHLKRRAVTSEEDLMMEPRSSMHRCVFAGVDDQEPAEAAASGAKGGGSADKLSSGEVVADAFKVNGCSPLKRRAVT